MTAESSRTDYFTDNSGFRVNASGGEKVNRKCLRNSLIGMESNDLN